MTSRQHPVQAITVSPDSSTLYLAISDTLFAVSATTRETLAKWKAPAAQPPAASQKPPPKKKQKKKTGDAEEASGGNKEDAGKKDEGGDVEMKDSTTPPHSAEPEQAVGKRKRSPSASSALEATATATGASTADASTETVEVAENENEGTQKGQRISKFAAPAKQGAINFIGHLLVVSDSLLAVSTLEDKSLRLLNLETLEVVKEWSLHKRPSSISSIQPSTILVGDKFGDVYSYIIPSSTTSATDSAPDLEDGKLLLGHVSLLTAVIAAKSLSTSKQYIITADRDEHIRITNYPLSHAIHSFCLGHTAFVSRILVLSNNTLLSGGGDDWLGLWDWESGKLLEKVDLRDAVDGLFDEQERKNIIGGIYRRRRDVEIDYSRISIAVSGLWEVGSEVIVTLEGVPAILRFSYAGEQLSFSNSIRTSSAVLSVTVDGQRILIGCDHDNQLVHVMDLTESNNPTSFFKENGFDGIKVGSESDSITDMKSVKEKLYIVESLRKEVGGIHEQEED